MRSDLSRDSKICVFSCVLFFLCVLCPGFSRLSSSAGFFLFLVAAQMSYLVSGCHRSLLSLSASAEDFNEEHQHRLIAGRQRAVTPRRSFRASPLIGGHWSKSSRGPPFSCSNGLLIGVELRLFCISRTHFQFCSSIDRALVDICTNVQNVARLFFGTQLGCHDQRIIRLIPYAFFKGWEYDILRYKAFFQLFVILVLVALGCLVLYSGFCESAAYCIYDCIYLVWLQTSASLDNPIRND